jgi:hypothetical protein
MTGDLSQDDRTGSLATPLGKDVPVLSRFEGATFSVTSAAVSIAGPTSVQPGLAVNGAIAWTSAALPPPVPVPA